MYCIVLHFIELHSLYCIAWYCYTLHCIASRHPLRDRGARRCISGRRTHGLCLLTCRAHHTYHAPSHTPSHTSSLRTTPTPTPHPAFPRLPSPVTPPLTLTPTHPLPNLQVRLSPLSLRAPPPPRRPSPSPRRPPANRTHPSINPPTQTSTHTRLCAHPHSIGPALCACRRRRPAARLHRALNLQPAERAPLVANSPRGVRAARAVRSPAWRGRRRCMLCCSIL